MSDKQLQFARACDFLAGEFLPGLAYGQLDFLRQLVQGTEEMAHMALFCFAHIQLTLDEPDVGLIKKCRWHQGRAGDDEWMAFEFPDPISFSELNPRFAFIHLHWKIVNYYLVKDRELILISAKGVQQSQGNLPEASLRALIERLISPDFRSEISRN